MHKALSPNLRKEIFIVCLLAAFIVLTRIPLGLEAKNGILISTDELGMSLSTVDRFLGVPSTSLAWPGGTVQLFSLPFIILKYVLDQTHELSSAGFVSYLAGIYQSPGNTVWITRLVVIIISSLGLAFLVFPLVRLTKSWTASIVSILLVSLSPGVWMLSHMAMGDAMAVGLASMAFTLIATREKDENLIWWTLAGIGMGMAVAAKLTIAYMLPLFLAYPLFGRRMKLFQDLFQKPTILKKLFTFLLSMGLGFLIANPYTWTDPIRFAKSVIGNLIRAGDPLGILGVGKSLIQIYTAPTLVLASIGLLVLLVKRRESNLLLGSTLCFILIIISTMNAGVVYERYYLPLTVPLILLIAFALEHIRNIIQKRFYQRLWLGALTISLVGAIVIFSSATSYVASGTCAMIMDRQLSHFHSQLSALPRSKVLYVPFEVERYFMGLATTESIKELLERQAQLETESSPLISFISGSGLPADVAQSMMASFNEDEQSRLARLRLLSVSDSHSLGIHELRVYSERKAIVERFGLWSEEEMYEQIGSNSTAAIVLNQTQQNMCANVIEAQLLLGELPP